MNYYIKRTFPVLFILLAIGAHEQAAPPPNLLYGFRHMQMMYKGDTVDILIKSKKGEELKAKPLFLFCQGSLPIPLIMKYEEQGKKGIYHVFVFNPEHLSNDYHLVIIGKPYVPLVADVKQLKPDFTYMDSSGTFPKKYIDRNLLDYYVGRDIAVIKYLQKTSWVSTVKLVVAGHSEGSTIAAKIASDLPEVTQLIYSGGNPYGRMLTIIEQQRSKENDTAAFGEQAFSTWEKIVADPTNMTTGTGDTYKSTFGFSIPPKNYLEQLKIPVLITYGTKDYGSPFNDYFRMETILQKKKNFTFKAYIGVQHNYFPLNSDGEPDFSHFNWDKVADDWKKWLDKQ